MKYIVDETLITTNANGIGPLMRAGTSSSSTGRTLTFAPLKSGQIYKAIALQDLMPLMPFNTKVFGSVDYQAIKLMTCQK